MIPNRENKKFNKEIANIIESFLLNAKDNQLASPKTVQDEIRTVIRRHIIRTKKKYPIITPTVFFI